MKITVSDSESGDQRMKIRLKFNSAATAIRKITVLADENATMGYDADFDTEMSDLQTDDMYWLVGTGKYLNQGIDVIDLETVLPLGISTNSNGMNIIAIDKLENIPDELNIFVHDKDLGVFHSIKDGAYAVHLNAGTYLNRFEIVFKQPDTLSTNELMSEEKTLEIFI